MHSKGEAGYFNPLDTPGFLVVCFRLCGGRGPLCTELNPEMGAWGLVVPPLVFLEQLWGPRLFDWCVLDYGDHIGRSAGAKEYFEVSVVVAQESSRVGIHIDDVPFRGNLSN